MTLEYSIEYVQLPQSINELRILGGVLPTNRRIETTEKLLERIIVAFAMTAG